MVYWLVSIPAPPAEADACWNSLQEDTTYQSDLSVNFHFKVPDFRVGTLDTLLGLSDDLLKVNSSVEGTVNKIRRQLFELQSSAVSGGGGEEAEEAGSGGALVEGTSPVDYLQHFEWQEAKFPVKRPLKQTIGAITDVIQALDDDLKLRTTEYTQLKTQLQGVLRKRTGSLAVRDLSDVVGPETLVDTENLVTLLVVVPRSSVPEFFKVYETLVDFGVVPRSAALAAEDAEHSVLRVVLFRRAADDFKAAARAKGFTAKEVAADAEAAKGNAEAVQRLRATLEAKRAEFEAWCAASYSEAFGSWIHVLAVRLFVESILRYGLPPQFVPVLMRPNPKHVSKLRKLLASKYAGVGSQFYGGEGGQETDIYPYVSFTLAIEERGA